MDAIPQRSEQTIFDDLSALCTSAGYIHAFGYICATNNYIGYVEGLKPKDLEKMFSWERLIRTELTTLLGLMLKAPIVFDAPDVKRFEHQVAQTYSLLEELHQSLDAAFLEGIDLSRDAAEIGRQMGERLSSGKVLREPIFYAGESAYSFQFRDLAVPKYRDDDEWLLAKKGFTISAAQNVARTIQTIQDDKLTDLVHEWQRRNPCETDILGAFSFSEDEVRSRTGQDRELIARILSAFCLPEGANNEQFCSLGDFNIISAAPIMRHKDGRFILFEQYSLVEALYDAPFYWMAADRHYTAQAMQHRGNFAEQFSAERLRKVFGTGRVFTNIDIFESKARKVGEIDVLVVFANRLIVVQAKSKRLTLESRRGNDGQIREDFKKSVQNSYEQAQICATALTNPNLRFLDREKNTVAVPRTISQVYIFCVLSDHYPALSFQVSRFLEPQPTAIVRSPFVMDVFTLDAMTEMLESPLHFLSYIDKRTGYAERLHAGHEMTILSFHLKRNLWIEDQYEQVFFGDEFSAELDAAMIVRRDGLPGERTPDGILTRISKTTLGKVVADIEHSADPRIVDLGMVLLTLSEDAFKGISKGMERIAHLARQDGKPHDCTVLLDECGTGLTIHCNQDPVRVAARSLRQHCQMRKYMAKSEKWFGICVSPNTLGLRFGITFAYPWETSEKLDMLTKNMNRKPMPLRELAIQPKKKLGRNDACPCGSGRKYKKCCLV